MSKKTPVEVHVIGRTASGNMPVVLAGVMVTIEDLGSKNPLCEEKTDASGTATFELDESSYRARVTLSPAPSAAAAYPPAAIEGVKEFKASGAAKCPVEVDVTLPTASFKLTISDEKGGLMRPRTHVDHRLRQELLSRRAMGAK